MSPTAQFVVGIILAFLGISGAVHKRNSVGWQYLSVALMSVGTWIIILAIVPTTGALGVIRPIAVMLVFIAAGLFIMRAEGVVSTILGVGVFILGIIATFRAMPESWQSTLAATWGLIKSTVSTVVSQIPSF